MVKQRGRENEIKMSDDDDDDCCLSLAEKGDICRSLLSFAFVPRFLSD